MIIGTYGSWQVRRYWRFWNLALVGAARQSSVHGEKRLLHLQLNWSKRVIVAIQLANMQSCSLWLRPLSQRYIFDVAVQSVIQTKNFVRCSCILLVFLPALFQREAQPLLWNSLTYITVAPLCWITVPPQETFCSEKNFQFSVLVLLIFLMGLIGHHGLISNLRHLQSIKTEGKRPR